MTELLNFRTSELLKSLDFLDHCPPWGIQYESEGMRLASLTSSPRRVVGFYYIATPCGVAALLFVAPDTVVIEDATL